MKSFRVTKLLEEIKFQEVWGELGPKNRFPIQSFTKYLRQTLVFI